MTARVLPGKSLGFGSVFVKRQSTVGPCAFRPSRPGHLVPLSSDVARSGYARVGVIDRLFFRDELPADKIADPSLAGFCPAPSSSFGTVMAIDGGEGRP